MPSLDDIDQKINVVIKDLKSLKEELETVKNAVEALDDSGMVYMVSGEIKQKLDEILERLP